VSKFRSKVDSWLFVLLIVAIAAQVFALVAVTNGDASGSEKIIVIAIIVPGVLLTTSVLLRTHYSVYDGKVRIVSGPFAWTILVSEIEEITESHSVVSSPALSLDRLKIRYRQNRHISVSPADKKGFLKAIEEYAA
jgi:hypothetical protein